jgi:TolB protein
MWSQFPFPESIPMRLSLLRSLFRPVTLCASLSLVWLSPTALNAQQPPKPAAAPAAAAGGGNIWTLNPTFRYDQSSIAVMPFNAKNATVESATFPRIIRRDLELSGFFKNLDEAKMQQAGFVLRKDDKTGTIAFDEWTTLGAEYVLRGNLADDGTTFRIIVQVFDINSKRQILNRTFTDRKERMRDLAHQISDAVIFQIKGIQGVCRTKMLYVSESVPGTKEIAIVDADGFNARALTRYGKLATSPVWGANGTEMYYGSYHGNRANVYGMQLQVDSALNFGGGKDWTIAAFGGTSSNPAWSQPTGRVAMMLSKDGNTEIYSCRRDGSDLQRLTETKFTEGSPTWSPDGSKIAFTSNEGGRAQLYIMGADGSGKRKVPVAGSWNDAVSWSPDGKWLLFVSRQGGVNDIFICDPNGGNAKRLTKGQGNNESPSWAPNSVHISFASNRTGTWQVYTMLDDGSNQNQITATGRNSMPDWGPIPPTATK